MPMNLMPMKYLISLPNIADIYERLNFFSSVSQKSLEFQRISGLNVKEIYRYSIVKMNIQIE